VSKDFVFVSGNLKKVEYLELFLGRKVEHHNLDLTEIQSLDPEEVVEHKAKEAYRLLKKPVVIEDTSLTFNAWGNLPGPFIKFFLEEMGNEGLCKMMSVFDDKSAISRVIYGLYDGITFESFSAIVTGKVRDEPKGSFGMGWDPIFIPDNQPKTYAEMTEEEHASFSVRNMAVKKLSKYLHEG